MKSIEERIRTFLLETFLPGQEPASLQDDTPLVTGRILDSISSLKLVVFLEEEFGVELGPHELDVEYLDTIGDIAALVREKQAAL